MFGYFRCQICGELYNEYDNSGSCRCRRGSYDRDVSHIEQIISDLRYENTKLSKENTRLKKIVAKKNRRIETLIEQLKRSRLRD